MTQAQIETALASQRQTFLPLGRILCDQHGLSRADLAAALRRQHFVPRVYLRFFPADASLADLLEEKFCQEHEIVAFERFENLLCVAMSQPRRGDVARHLEVRTGLEIKVFQAPWEDIQRRLRESARRP
jgi:hypothetical protein